MKGLYYNKQLVNMEIVASVNFDDEFFRIRFYAVGPAVIDEWNFDEKEVYEGYKTLIFKYFNL